MKQNLKTLYAKTVLLPTLQNKLNYSDGGRMLFIKSKGLTVTRKINTQCFFGINLTGSMQINGLLLNGI